MDKLFFTKEQMQILDMQLLYPQKGVCNIGGIMMEKIKDDPTIPIKAMQYVIEDILIFNIQVKKDNTPYLAKQPVNIVKWKNITKPTYEELTEWMGKSFPFYDEPLYEICYWIGDNYISIYMKAHHIIVDGYSFVLLHDKFKDYICKMYRGLPVNREIDDKYVIAMHNKEINSTRENEWIHDLMKIDMPENWRIIKNEGIDSRRKTYVLSKDQYNTITEYARRKNLTIESIFFGSISIYLSKIRMSNRVCIGRSMINRKKNDMDIVGMKVNQMPTFIDVLEDDTFDIHCKKVMSILFQMMRVSSASFTEYMRKNNHSNDYYDTGVSYRNVKLIPAEQFNHLKEISSGYQEIPLRFYVNDKKNIIEIQVQYQTTAYKENEIDATIERLFHIIGQGISGIRIKQCSVLAAIDHKLWKLLNSDFNKQYKCKLLMHDFRCMSNKKSIAVIYDDLIHDQKVLTYRELWEKSDRIAHWILNQQVHIGEFVGVQMKVSELLPIVFLGIWKAGASFVPIGVNESKERIDKIKKDCIHIITERQALEAIQYGEYTGQLPDIRPEMTAYCMYTSGSTGQPKLVMISHASLAWRVHWMVEQYGKSGAVLQKASYTFDVSMWEFFLPLCQGEILYLLPDCYRADPYKIVKAIQRGKIATIHFVPAMLSIFLTCIENNKIILPEIKHVYSSGEPLQAVVVQQFYRCFQTAKLHNLYGPTECTIDVTYYECTGKEKRVPIGKPIPGTMIEILNQNGDCVPVGVEGNLVVGGVLVGQGYWGYDSKQYYTDAKIGIRKYNTGDKAILGFDGQIYYCGREDKQCKINGMRIDLTQIEANMLHVPEIIRAVVMQIENHLVGIYMSKAPIRDIANKIAYDLPIYSIPTEFVWIKDIPLTRNGKTDYQCLKQYLAKKDNKRQVKQPKNKEEEIIVECVQKKIGKKISVNDNLFLNGLDSIKLMEVILDLEENGYNYTAEEFYKYGTVENIVASKNDKIQWLYNNCNTHAILAFPYAAGTADAYKKFADEMAKYKIDFGVTRSDDLKEVSELYEKIILLGYCTGTALAMTAYEKMPNKAVVSGIILCAALPPERILKQFGSPWKLLGDKKVGKLIQYLHRENIDISDPVIKMFRKESSVFFDYFKLSHKVKVRKVLLIFGQKDILTKGCKKKWKIWNKYLDAPISKIVYKNEYHFFLDSKTEEMTKAILDIFR